MYPESNFHDFRVLGAGYEDALAPCSLHVPMVAADRSSALPLGKCDDEVKQLVACLSLVMTASPAGYAQKSELQRDFIRFGRAS